MDINQVLITILLGLVVGSFLNVCIYRLPKSQSIINPPSHCGSCQTRLGYRDLIPVISYLVLQGRCRFCGSRISPRYAIIELLTAALFVWSLTRFGFLHLFFISVPFISFLIIITFIDFDYQLILDKILSWFAAVGFIINSLTGTIYIWDMIVASLVGGGLLLLIAVITRGGMGGGDIKFVAALGLWLGLKLTLLTIFLSFIIGGLGGALLLLTGIKKRKDFIPFGPFIAISAFISLLYGQEIISWYLTNFFK